MQLTPNQQTMIQRHLRGVALSLDPNWPETRRLAVVQEEKSRILRHLMGLGKTTVSDGDVAEALEVMLTGASSKPARPGPDPESVLMLQTDGRMWLGVCGGVAARLRLERWVVRTVFVLLGCLLGPLCPLALLLYMGLYAKMHAATPPDMRPELHLTRSAIRAVGAIAAILILHHASLWGVRLIFHGNDQLLARYGEAFALELTTLELGKWDWLRERAPALRRWALFFIVPTALLSGLALANAWDHTLKRAFQAMIALYGAVLCFGIASVLVGILLHVVAEFRSSELSF